MKKILFLIAFNCLAFLGFAQTAAADSTNLQQYVGTFKFQSTFQQCVFELKSDGLYVEIDQYGQNKVLREPEADKFKSTSSYGTLFTFLRNDKKEIKGIKIELMGQSLEGEKE
jgi:Domain of unknown function (DUF3471)